MIRHPVFRIIKIDSSYHLAMIRVPGNNSIFTGFVFLQRPITEQQTEVCLLAYTTVTSDAFFIEDRFDLSIEINFFVGSSKRKCSYGNKNYYSKKKDFFISKQSHQ